STRLGEVMAGINLQFELDALQSLIEAVIAETVARLDAARSALPDNGKLAFSEPEAARLLSLRPHQLRDERLRGRIKASMGPGRKILYARQDLLDYLTSRRWERSRG